MKGVARAASLTLGAFVLAAFFDYAFVAAMSWLLPQADYGALSVAMTYFLLLSFFVANGFPMSLAKFLSESPDPPKGLVRFALAGNLIVATLVVSLFLFLTFYGPLSPGPGYGRLVVAVAASVMLLAVGTTLQFALQGRMSFSSFAVLHASKSVNKLVLGGALVLLGFGVVGALGGIVLGSAVLIVGSLVVLRNAPREAGRALERADKRNFLRYTVLVFAGSFALTLLMSLDLLAVKYLTPAAESNVVAASYQAATIVTKAPLWGVLAALTVLFPLLSRASKTNPAEATRLLQTTLRWMLLALAPVTVMLLLFPERAISIAFPAHYASAAPTLAASALGMAALAVCLVLTRALQATGRARAPGVFLGASVALQVVLLWFLVPKWGSVGAAAATTVACVLGCALAVAACAKPFQLRVRVRSLAALAASLAVMSGVLFALHPTSRMGALLSFALGGVAFGACAVAFKLVPLRELLSLRKKRVEVEA